MCRQARGCRLSTRLGTTSNLLDYGYSTELTEEHQMHGIEYRVNDLTTLK
jgi:hypothetical protein